MRRLPIIGAILRSEMDGSKCNSDRFSASNRGGTHYLLLLPTAKPAKKYGNRLFLLAHASAMIAVSRNPQARRYFRLASVCSG